MTPKSLADIREEYLRAGLLEADLDPSPFTQFQKWFDQAAAAEESGANAATLATATRDAIPSARIVLLKGIDERGFTFFTNYESRKGHELTDNPKAALVFFWKPLERQVRIEGAIEKVTADESDAYFRSRPLASKLGAWASAQSEVISSRDVLESRFADLETKYASGDVPRPPFWGGFRLNPRTMEFWQGRASRLHDRLQYTNNAGAWTVARLSP
jgi:pyridoxamine 5'-phosphate oxidase